MSLSVTQFGKPLSKEKYTWDEENKIFSSKEEHLLVQCYVKHTTFNTGSNCTFVTGCDCTFRTGHDCIFNTGENCIFKTEHSCDFKTEGSCIFKTRHSCTFSTSDNCTFITDNDCIFDTGNGCTFNTSNGCTFTTGYNCVIIRQDIFEIIKIPKNTTIMLNKCGIQGFTKIKSNKTIIVDGKTIEITNKGFEILKKSLLAEIMNDNLDNAVYMASLRREVPPK